jgi:hypothetical protein
MITLAICHLGPAALITNYEHLRAPAPRVSCDFVALTAILPSRSIAADHFCHQWRNEMSDKDKTETVVFSGDASALTEAHINELQTKYGLQLKVRSTAGSVAKALGKIGDAAVQYFDRVNPGYERTFDRTGPADEASKVINPVELETHVRSVAEKVLATRLKPSGGG